MPEHNLYTSSFKRFLLRILLPLLCLIIAAGTLFNYAFEKLVIMNSKISGAYKVERIIRETHTDEIPIFGSSRAEGGYIPDSLGVNFFNYGLSGTKYDVLLFFLEQECKKKKSRPWVIMNIDLEGLTYGIGNPANYVPGSYKPELRKIMGDQYHPWYALLATRFYGLYEHYTREYLKDKMTNPKFTNKGASLEQVEYSEAKFAELVAERRKTATTFKITPALLTRMNAIITAHPERYFIFVVAPVHSSCFDGWTNAAEADAFFAALNAMKNAHVFNFSKQPLADKMFLNTTHVNYKGAAVFCHALKDSLISIGVK